MFITSPGYDLSIHDQNFKQVYLFFYTMTWLFSHTARSLRLDKQWKLLESFSSLPFHTNASLGKKKNEMWGKITSMGSKKGNEPPKGKKIVEPRSRQRSARLADFIRNAKLITEKENRKKKTILQNKREEEAARAVEKVETSGDVEKNPKEKE